MSLWRLEWLRLVRTRRLLALVGVFAFFGALGPLGAAYLSELVERFGGGVEVVFPDPVPADGLAQYLANAAQIGLLVVVFVAATSLAFDATPQIGVFLRSRVRSAARLLLPKWLVPTAAAAGAHLIGTAVAWYETVLLIGRPPLTALLVGPALGALFLAMATALTALAAQLTRSALAAGAVTVVVLLLTTTLGALEQLAVWLPHSLMTAGEGLARGESVTEWWRAAAVTVAATAGLLAAAVPLAARREL